MEHKKGFWVDFSGSIFITSENINQAKEDFWDFISTTNIEYTEINDIEEKSDEI